MLRSSTFVLAARSTVAALSLVLAAAVAQEAKQPAKPPAAGDAALAQAHPILAVGADSKARLQLALTNPAAAAAILRGIEWLLAHQDESGRFDCATFMKHDGDDKCDGAGNPANDVGVTGLALLALAREGDPGAKDRRKDAMARAADWLMEQQDEKGLIGTTATQHHAYGHATATLALCAVFAATRSEKVRDAAKKAVEHVESRRNPLGVWRYQPREADGDTSITAWSVLACLAGREIGLATDDKALATTAAFLDAVTDDNGRAGYTKAGEGSSRNVGKQVRFPADRTEALTAAAMWCRGGLGKSQTPKFDGAAELLLKLPPEWQPGAGKVDFCYWFFGAEAMRRCVPGRRDLWMAPLTKALVDGQCTKGPALGSWDTVDPWSDDGGRIYTTAMAVLALQCLYAPPPQGNAKDGAPK